MDNKQLYDRLFQAYSPENLNRISASLIEMYKNKRFDQLRLIISRISNHVVIDEEKDSRCFSRLIMLYHPDKVETFRKEITHAFHNNDEMQLTSWSHIFLLDNLQNLQALTIDPQVDYTPEYTWDNRQSSGYRIYDHEDDNHIDFNEYIDVEPNVFNAIKLREYGDLSIELPSYYLEDLDELELAFQGIEMLDGIEFCRNLVTLDLSHNSFIDLDLLWDLPLMEELFLAENGIEEIGVLSNLQRLRIIDLSGNHINDITPLLELEELTFVNLLGNAVDEDSVKELKEKGVVVLW